MIWDKQNRRDVVVRMLERFYIDDEVKKLHKSRDVKGAAEYLRSRYGNGGHAGIPSADSGDPWSVMGSKTNGITMEFRHELNNLGDKVIRLTWHTAAVTIFEILDRKAAEAAKPVVAANTQPSADNKGAPSESYLKALDLNKRIIGSALLAQQNIYDMCMGFKEMRDSKLYKELGYSDFGDYCEQETGFKRSQAYNYIAIAEKLPEDFVHSSGQIGVKKLTLLTTLSEEERAQIAAETDLESATVKELEKEIKQLRADKDKAVADKDKQIFDLKKNQMDTACKLIDAENAAEQMEKQIKELETQNMLTNTNLSNIERNYDELEKRYKQLGKDNTALSLRVKELENAPTPVATQIVEKVPDEYVSREDYDEILRTAEENLAEKQELEKRIAELENSPRIDLGESFKLLCQICRDPLNRLMLFAYKNPIYRKQALKFVGEATKVLEDENK